MDDLTLAIVGMEGMTPTEAVLRELRHLVSNLDAGTMIVDDWELVADAARIPGTMSLELWFHRA